MATGSSTVLTLGGFGAGDGWFLDEIAVLLTSSGYIDLRKGFFTGADPEGRALIFNGGTLKLTGTTTTGQAVTILVTGGTIDSNGNILYLTGTVTGAGALTVSGSGGGEVHLNSLVTVPITVDSTGVLRGTGIIFGNTIVAGTLSPGNSPGTLTFAAPVTMQSGSTLALDIDGAGTGNGAGNYSRVIVTGGNSFTAAGTLAPRLRGITYAATEVQGTNSYTPALGQKFAGVVQADGGVLGSFTGLTQPEGLRAGTRFDAVYNPTSLDLYVTPAAYGNLAAAGVGQTRNQSQVGAALDAFRPAAGTLASGDTKTLFDALAPLDGAALPRALTQIAGEGNANLPLTAVEVGRSFGGAVSARLGQLRGGGIAAQAASHLTSLALSTDGGIGHTGPSPSAGPEGEAAGDSPAASPWATWGRAFGSFTDNTGDGNNPGFRRTTGGGVAGADLALLDELRVGFTLGYARSAVTGNQSSGNATADSYHVGLYGGWTPDASFLSTQWFVNGGLGVTVHRFETRRSLEFGTLSRATGGKTTGIGGDVELEAGTRYNWAGFTFEPSVDVRYDLVGMSGYTESGAGILDLAVRGERHHALRAGLGGRVTRSVELGAFRIEPELSARWLHDLTDQSYRTPESVNGSEFSVTASRPGRDAALLGAGIAAVLDDNLKLYAHYDAEVRRNQTSHAITAGLRYQW